MPPVTSFADCWPMATTWSRGSRATAWLSSRPHPRPRTRRGAAAGPPSTARRSRSPRCSNRPANSRRRPVGILVRFVVVLHPQRGAILLMCTDLTLSPLDVIRIYGLRFKIEVSFTQALHVIGAYAYHFWMAAMTPLRRVSGNQYLHRKSDDYRHAVRRKIAAYHRHIQLGLIAQGLLQILSAIKPTLVWQSFGP